MKVHRSRTAAKNLPVLSIASCIFCAAALFAPRAVHAQDPQQTLKVDGIDRTFVVHLPTGYDAKNKYPVVVLLHSTGQNAQDMMRLSRFDGVADRHGIIAVYPNAYGVRWDIGVAVAPANRPMGRRGGFGGRGGIGFPMPYPRPYPGGGGGQGGEGRNSQNRAQSNDVAFFDQMLDKLAATYSIDATRIFATGYSGGGVMDFRIGCSMGRRFAAIAPVAAAIPKEMATWCGPSRAVPLLMLNGTSDPIIHYGGGSVKGSAFSTLPVQKSAETWAKLAGCTPKPTHSTLPPHDKRGMKTKVDTHGECREGSEVALYTIEGGGNTWPGGDQFMPESEVGKTSTDLDADEVIWKFFSAHPMPASLTGN